MTKFTTIYSMIYTVMQNINMMRFDRNSTTNVDIFEILKLELKCKDKIKSYFLDRFEQVERSKIVTKEFKHDLETC